MAKRGPQGNVGGGAQKKKCSQMSLMTYFKPAQANQSTPSTSSTVVTPGYYGINLYTEADISSAVGLQRDFRTYWNDKAHEICADKTIRAHLGSKAAIQGTIYTSWTLHKTHLLELQAEELQGVAKQLYNDEIALLADFSTIKNNLERMLQCYASVTTLAERAKSLNIAEKTAKEEEIEKELSDLKKAQNALHQAMERKRAELIARKIDIEEEEMLTASSPVQLSTDEMEQLIETVRSEDD